MKKIGVVGAGMMGAEIALCFAMAGYEIVLNDISQEIAYNGKRKQEEVLDKRIKKGKLEENQKNEILDHVTATGNINDLADCDFIVEAVLENLEVKTDVYRCLDSICKSDTMIASNTSSISITKLAAVLSEQRKPLFIGTHFNSPASVMKLVEVIPGLLTSEDTVARTIELLCNIGKENVKVKDVVGFALNRIFHSGQDYSFFPPMLWKMIPCSDSPDGDAV